MCADVPVEVSQKRERLRERELRREEEGLFEESVLLVTRRRGRRLVSGMAYREEKNEDGQKSWNNNRRLVGRLVKPQAVSSKGEAAAELVAAPLVGFRFVANGGGDGNVCNLLALLAIA